MSITKGLRAATARSPTAKSARVIAAGGMTLDDPTSWLTGEENAAMSRSRAMKIATVNRCVEVLSTSMAVMPVYLMNERTKERLGEHPLARMLWSRANEAMTSFDYQRLMMCNELLRGNAYAWLVRDAKSGRVTEQIPLPPDCVSPLVLEDGKLWYAFTHPHSGETRLLRSEDVLHYKAYSEDGIEGVSILKRAALTLSTAKAASVYENSMWKNGGRPSGVLTTESDLGGYVEDRNGKPVKRADGTLLTRKEQVRQAWESVHQGADKAFRLAVLDLGLKYQPIAMTNSDAQFVQSSEIRVADVCRFFGVPLHLAYAGKQSYASNEQNGIEFVNYTLLGYETQWGQEDSYKLLLPGERDEGLRIKRELKVFLRGDTAAQTAHYREMRSMGALNADEIRALEDRGTIPGGDIYYANLSYVPLGSFEALSAQKYAPDAGKDE